MEPSSARHQEDGLLWYFHPTWWRYRPEVKSQVLQTLSTTEISAVRIALIDAQPILRAGLRAVMAEEKGLELVTEARSLDEALEQIKARTIDVVILGVRKPVSRAVSDLQKLKEHCPNVVPIVFTSLQDVACLRLMLAAGARAYLLIDFDREEVVEAIKAAGRGRTIKLPTDMTLGFIRGVPSYEHGSGTDDDGVASFNRLTSRERDILDHMATGSPYRTIAESLILAESTVKKYAHNVITKLGASNRASAVLTAYRLNLLPESAGEICLG